MSEFSIVFRYSTTTHVMVHDDYTSKWSEAKADGCAYFCADRTAGYFCSSRLESGDYEIYKRSTTDGTLIDTFNCTNEGIGEQYPFQIDHLGNIWMAMYGGDTIYKLASDFSTITSYQVDASVVGRDFYNFSMSEDGQYIWVTGPAGGNRNQLAMLSIDDLTGSPIWQVDLGVQCAVYAAPGESNNSYVSGYGGDQRTRKISGVDGSVMWGGTGYVSGAYNASYCFENGRLFIPQYGVSGADHYCYQYDPDDGAYIGRSIYQPARCVGANVFDENVVITSSLTGGGSPEEIIWYDITSDWPTIGETDLGSYNHALGQHHSTSGDPTGYINYRIRLNNPVASTGIPRNLMMIVNR